MSFESEKRYIDPRTGRIKENILKKDAIDLPNGKYYFKTIFKADSLVKAERMIKALDRRTLYLSIQRAAGAKPETSTVSEETSLLLLL